MSVAIRIAVVGLAAFAVTSLVAALIVPALAGWWPRGAAAVRARRLVALRLAPSALAGAAAAVVTLAFIGFEPRWDEEEIGLTTPAFAAFAAVLLAAATWRGLRVASATRRLVSRWLAAAEPVALDGIAVPAFALRADFPIVAVIGLRRPKLLIARSVLESCSGEELRAILAHEQGHIDRRDNLRRLLLAIAPDILTWLPASDRLSAAWRDATEEAADDDAARCGSDGRVRLASALVKVARLAPGAPAQALMPASALYRGEGLEHRVRRLLAAGRPVPARSAPRWISAVAWGSASTLSLLLLEDVHAFVERVIHTLP